MWMNCCCSDRLVSVDVVACMPLMSVSGPFSSPPPLSRLPVFSPSIIISPSVSHSSTYFHTWSTTSPTGLLHGLHHVSGMHSSCKSSVHKDRLYSSLYSVCCCHSSSSHRVSHITRSCSNSTVPSVSSLHSCCLHSVHKNISVLRSSSHCRHNSSQHCCMEPISSSNGRYFSSPYSSYTHRSDNR